MHFLPFENSILVFTDAPTTETYTLSLHDALPICRVGGDDHGARARADGAVRAHGRGRGALSAARDRKSTRLNSSHLVISYAVFCLKKKRTDPIIDTHPSHERTES